LPPLGELAAVLGWVLSQGLRHTPARFGMQALIAQALLDRGLLSTLEWE